MKTSKIKSVQSAGIKNGWHNYEISLEDGVTALKGFKETPTHLTEGREVQYEIHEKYNNVFSKIQVTGFNGKSETQFKADPAKQNSIEAQTALKSALDFHSSHGIQDCNSDIPNRTDQQIVCDTADIFYEWLKSKK